LVAEGGDGPGAVSRAHRCEQDAEFALVRRDGDVRRGGEGRLHEGAALVVGAPVVGRDGADEIALDLVGHHLEQVRVVLALGGELDHLALGPLPHGDPTRDGSAPPLELHRLGDGGPELAPDVPVEKSAARLCRAKLPERSLGADASGDLGDALARRAELGIDLGPLRIGHLARGVVRLHRVVDERVEGVLFAKVLEEVLLPPPLEHPIGNLDGGRVAAGGDDGRLVTVLGEPGDLAQA
jgi:hypothetical protein